MKYIICIVEKNERKTTSSRKKDETKIGDTHRRKEGKKGGAGIRREKRSTFRKKRKHSDTANSIMVKLFYF